MKTQPSKAYRCLRQGLALLIGLTAAQSLQAAIPARIMNKTGQILEASNIRWQASRQQYVIMRGSGSSIVEVPIPLAQVEQLQIPKPNGLDAAIQTAATSPASAISQLEKYVEVYTMLNWDIPAGTALINAYIATKQARKAVTVAQSIMRFRDPSQVSGELSAAYLSALIESGNDLEARKIIEQMIKSGSRDAAAGALLRRGDMLSKKEMHREALIDGYLRVVTLFREISAVQPEALYSAAQSFKALGQHAHADKMKKQLIDRFGSSSYAAKARSGA